MRVLVHVDGLHVHPRRQRHAEILVLGFALADDGVAGKSDPVRRDDADWCAPRVECRPPMRHVPSYPSRTGDAVFGYGALVFVLEVCGDYAHVGEGHEELVHLVVLLLVPFGTVHLRADQVVILGGNEGLDVGLGNALEPRKYARRVGVRRHASNSSHERLAPAAGPPANFAESFVVLSAV